jgi:hypothetical protein
MLFPLGNRVFGRRYGANDYLAKRAALNPKGTLSDGEKLDTLYDALNILDSKASALMTFDSILLAAASVALVQEPPASGPLHVLVAASGALSLSSIVIGLFVVALDWPFLSEARRIQGGYDFSTEIDLVSRVMIFRQDFYRAAWSLALLAVGFFLVAYGGYLWKLTR